MKCLVILIDPLILSPLPCYPSIWPASLLCLLPSHVLYLSFPSLFFDIYITLSSYISLYMLLLLLSYSFSCPPCFFPLLPLSSWFPCPPPFLVVMSPFLTSLTFPSHLSLSPSACTPSLTSPSLLSNPWLLPLSLFTLIFLPLLSTIFKNIYKRRKHQLLISCYGL